MFPNFGVCSNFGKAQSYIFLKRSRYHVSYVKLFGGGFPTLSSKFSFTPRNIPKTTHFWALLFKTPELPSRNSFYHDDRNTRYKDVVSSTQVHYYATCIYTRYTPTVYDDRNTRYKISCVQGGEDP